jgi:hypothetical protein
MRYQEETQASDGDMGEYIGSSSEEVDAPVSVGTKRDYTRQRTAAPGPVNSGTAEEMDRDGADDGGGGPCWIEMTRNQKKNGRNEVDEKGAPGWILMSFLELAHSAQLAPAI